MIEILKQGTKRNVICPNCGAELRYDIRTDIIEGKFLDVYTGSRQLIIFCPCCNKQIVIRE